MLLLILFVALLSLPAYAGDTAPTWMTAPSGGVTVLHPHPGVEYLYDDHGHSATIYGTDPGLRWYSTQDAHTGKSSQGYLFDPHPRYTPTRPLALQPLAPMYPPAEIRR